MKIKTDGIETHCVIEGERPSITLSHSLACGVIGETFAPNYPGIFQSTV